MMKRISFAMLGVVLSLGIGTAFASEGQKEPEAQSWSWDGVFGHFDRAQLQRGYQVYKDVCAACHGMDGKGNQAVGAPNLTDGIWLYGSSEATIIEGINKGRHADGGGGHTPMPAHKDTLGAGKVQILAAYVWGLSNKPP